MSNQIANNLNIPNLDKTAIAFQQNGFPAMQGQGVPVSVDNNYLANRVNASKEADPRAVLGATAGIWGLTNLAMDKFSPACGDKYEKSILGKLGGWGDKFSKNTWVGRNLEKGLRKADAAFYKLSKKSKIVYSLRNHSTRAEWAFAKTPGAGVHGFFMTDTEHLFEEFLKPIADKKSLMGLRSSNCFQKLEQYGMSQKDINAFVESVKDMSFGEKALALQKKELELLGASPKSIQSVLKNRGLTGLQDYAKGLKVRALGFKSLKDFEALKGKFLENPKVVMEALERAAAKNPNLKISIWRGQGGINAIKNPLFGRTASISEYLNKYKAILGKGNTTKLGRFLPKSLAWLTEGCTNRFAGGKLGVLMQAYIFGDMLVNALNAPKGEKGKTIAERFVNDFSYFLGMPLGMMVMHKIGGFKYAGLDEAGRERYRKALEQLHANRDAGMYKTKASYKRAKNAVNKLLGTKNIKNPVTKLLHRAGRLINIGNERIKPYKSLKKVNLNWLRSLSNSNVLGVPIRFLFVMAGFSPMFAKATTKLTHKIFGRPTVSVLDEVPDEETNPTQNVPFQGQRAPVSQTAPAQVPADPNTFADSNLIKQTLNGQRPAAQPAPAQNPNSQVANDTPQEPVRTYIPSPQCMVPENREDMTAANMALANADFAEQRIINTLKSM